MGGFLHLFSDTSPQDIEGSGRNHSLRQGEQWAISNVKVLLQEGFTFIYFFQFTNRKETCTENACAIADPSY